MIKALREKTGAGVLDCKKALDATGGDFDKAVMQLQEKGLAAAAKKASREASEGLVNVVTDEAGKLGVIVEVNCETDFVARTDGFQQFVQDIAKQVAQETDVHDVPALLDRPFVGDKNTTVGEQLKQVIAKLGENMVLRRFARVERDESGLIEGYVHLGSRIGTLVYVATGSDDAAQSVAFQDLAHDLALQVAAAAPQYISADDIPQSVVEAERAEYQAQIAEEKKPDHIKERIIEGKLGKWYEQVCLLQQPFIKDNDLTIGDLIERQSKELGVPLSIKRFVRYELDAKE